MRIAALSATISIYGLAAILSFGAQQANLAPPPPVPPPMAPAPAISVPAGEGLILELQNPLNTKTTRKGDHVNLKVTNDVWAGGQVAIPQGGVVRATVKETKRPGRIFGKAEILLDFDLITLPGGTELPLTAKLSRAGWWESSGKIKQTKSEDRGRSHDAVVVGQGAATGAVLGTIMGGGSAAAKGAAAGAAVSVIGVLLQRGPELDLPPGMMFEVELTKPLAVPPAPASSQDAAPRSAPGPSPGTGEDELPRLTRRDQRGSGAPPVGQQTAPGESKPELTTTAANQTPPPPPPPAKPTDPPLSREELAGVGYKLKVSVNLVLVEATVRDERGAVVDNLKRGDFRLTEDGAPQQISHFSRDEMPLAVAIVVDRSGSVSPVLQKLREAALDTLSLLKPDDQVALFAFDSGPERLEYLTTDRERIAEAIARIRSGGGTNINDALFDAALYLSRAAPTRRHAIVLVSDNQNTVRGYASSGDVIRMCMESESTIYSIRISSSRASRYILAPNLVLGTGSVTKMANETGGEVFEAYDGSSIKNAMSAVISRLKKRYTLGYVSSNADQDGKFRKIDVSLNAKSPTPEHTYRIFARRGYYAPKAPTAEASKTP